MDLSGKVAIVTGAASGIGEAIVRLYVESSAQVVAVDANPAVETIAWPHRDSIRTVVGDVSEGEVADRYARTAVEAFGRADVMVNNAAISVVKPIHEHSPEEWDRVFAVNVKSIYQSARALVPLMKGQKSGLFLNTGSISSMVGIPGQGAYAPSKGAVIQITRQMAIEYAGWGIRSNAVCPGTVDTPMLRRAAADSGDPSAFLCGLESGHPIGRIAAAEEIAEFFLFLASDRARFFTGAILMIDGGFTAQ